MNTTLRASISRLIRFLFPRAFERLQAYRQYERRSRDSKLEPRLVPNLNFLFASPNHEMQAGTFEPNETAIVKILLRTAEVFVNVGANVGYYCCIALQQNKNCVAIEPIEENVQLLQRNLMANGWTKGPLIYPLAVSDTSGITRIFGGGTGASLVEGWAGLSQARFVPTVSLDTLLSGMWDQQLLIMMDVEGHEYFALKGATSLITTCVETANWIVEVSIDEHWPKGESNKNLLDTFDLFWNAGYSAYTIDGALREVTREEVAAVEKTGENTLRTHNFLFTSMKADALKGLRGALLQARTHGTLNFHPRHVKPV